MEDIYILTKINLPLPGKSLETEVFRTLEEALEQGNLIKMHEGIPIVDIHWITVKPGHQICTFYGKDEADYFLLDIRKKTI